MCSKRRKQKAETETGKLKTETGNGRQKLTRTQYSHESEMSLRELATHATEDGSRLLATERQSSLQVTVRLAKKSLSCS